jgi:uncharacterized protein
MSAIKIDSLNKLEQLCQQFMEKQPIHDSAHDINHIKRVVNNAKQIAEQEQADMWIVIAAAWLHDCVTYPKNHPDNKLASQKAGDVAVSFLQEHGFPAEKLDAVKHAVAAHSYSANIKVESLEAQVVQDADRLDGLGAIGIARCFNVAGKLQSKIYAEDDPFCENRQPDSKLAAVDHFYEKLFKTAETLGTSAAKRMGKQRIEFMQLYLQQLRAEIG